MRGGAPKEGPTDYEIELERIDRDLSELGDGALADPIDVEEATRFTYRLYHRVSLTGRLAEFDAVETAIDRAIRQVGPWADLCLLKANIDFKLHRLTEARRDLEMARGLADTPQGRALRADFDLQEGKYEEARRGYEDVIREYPTWDNLVRLAYFKAKMGDAEGAEQLYVEAEDEITAKEMRSYAWVELQRGLLDLAHGRYENARAHYERADAAYSGYWLVDEHIAGLLVGQGRFEDAVALYEQVVARVPRPDLQQALGDLYAAMGEPDRALPWHEKALAAYIESAQRGDVHYLHHLAAFYADVHQDGAEAVRWAREDLRLRPNFSTQAALAWTLYRNGRFDEALPIMQQALSSGVRDANLLSRAGMIYQAAGRIDEGKRCLREAAEINPHYQDVHVHY